MKKSFHFLLLLLLGFSAKSQHSITVQLDPAVSQPLQGRLYVFTTTDTSKTVQDPDPFNPSPVFITDVTNWLGGETRTLNENSAAWPAPINRLPPGWYKFAAVLDVDTSERNNTITPGNWYSKDVLVQIQENHTAHINLRLQQQIPKRPFRETTHIKYLELKSELVSGFRKKDSYIKAAVVLPPSYAEKPSAEYPVVFIIPGWGGTHYDVHSPAIAKRYGFTTGKEKIFVYLNPETSNPFGLHAFIDSRVNGPWGKALVSELIPLLKKQYRISNQFFVAGQSSGGYAALWLQLNYPKVFAGCWAVSPDPVDFSDFTGINLYEKNVNMYYDAEGKERGMFLMNGRYLGTIKKYAQFEDFLGTGGQMQSFEAAFGLPDGTSGKPQQLFNRQTGAVDPAVLSNWRPYDLGDFFETNYRKLSKQLRNKIFLYAGADDNFHLNRAVEAFQKRATKLQAPATVEIVPGANHWSIWTEAFTQQLHKNMDATIR